MTGAGAGALARWPSQLRALLALLAAIGVSALLRWLLRLSAGSELERRRAARRKVASQRAGAAPKVQQLCFLVAPELVEDSEQMKQAAACYAKINELPGVRASFQRYGSKTLLKAALLAEIGRPDASLGFTHLCTFVCDSVAALRGYLDSSFPGELGVIVGPTVKGMIVVDFELGVNMAPQGKPDPIIQNVLLRFQPHVTETSELYASFQQLIARFNKCPGVTASLQPLGHGVLVKEDLLRELGNKPDLTMGVTHCLTVVADSPGCLKMLVQNEAYSKWLQAETPHLMQDGHPPALVFISPLSFQVSR